MLMSVLCRPEVEPKDLFLVTNAMGLAVLDGVQRACGIDVRTSVGLKWPNDLITDYASTDGGSGGLKLAGMLAETIVVDKKIDAVVVGIGINVCRPTDVPGDVAEVAEWFDQLTQGQEIDDTSLVVETVVAFGRYLEALKSRDGRTALVDRYRTQCLTIGRQVKVEHVADGQERVTEGKATGVSSDGALIVESASGTQQFSVGDVIHARSTD